MISDSYRYRKSRWLDFIKSNTYKNTLAWFKSMCYNKLS